MMLLLTVFTTPGVWAQTPISDESSLKGALRNGANLQLTADIVLEKDDNILIIDAKYYAHTTQQRFDKATVHSANLYQIFTYVKNKQEELKDRQVTVSGMLLYAKTDEQIVPDNTYQMSGNQISVKTLGLNCGFDKIREQLDDLIRIIQ